MQKHIIAECFLKINRKFIFLEKILYCLFRDGKNAGEVFEK